MSAEPDDLERFIAERKATEPGFAAACDDADLRFALVDELVAARHRSGVSQSVVATAMQVKQPSISQFESNGSDPYLSTLQRYARALGGSIEIRFVPAPSCVDESEQQ